MEMVEQMRNLAQDIIASYDARISTVETIVDGTHNLLADFRRKNGEMSNQLRETLAKGESVRKKDFDSMMSGIRLYQEERERQVKRMLAGFLREQKEMSSKLKEMLTNAESGRIEEFKATLKEIQARQEQRSKEVSEMLKDFQKEQEETAKELRQLLDKSESLRIEDFKATISNIQARQAERSREVSGMLKGFRDEQEEAASHWQNLAVLMKEKRAGKIGREAVVIEEVAPLVSKEQQILEVLKDNPQGISLTDIGSALGVRYITLARAIKGLVEEGRVEKKDTLYFARLRNEERG
jgi:hypothetical protein